METYHERIYKDAGLETDFVQDNLSYSVHGTLQGLHYQFPKAQAKLGQVIQCEVFDVAVDIRRGSPTFGQWTSVILSDENKRQKSSIDNHQSYASLIHKVTKVPTSPITADLVIILSSGKGKQK